LTPLHHCASSCLLSDITFTEENVTSAITKLKSNLSCGPDDLPPLLFKSGNYFCFVLAQPLAILYQQLFSVSYVPPEWKHAIITPVFKNGLASSAHQQQIIGPYH